MKRIHNLLILRGGALGDFLLTGPALADFRRYWPHATIDLAAYPRYAHLAVSAGWVRQVLSLDEALMAQLYVPEAVRDPALVDRLRGYDTVVCYLEDPEQTIVQTLEAAGIRQRVWVSPQVTRGHAMDHFRSALGELGIEVKAGASVQMNLPAQILSPGVASRLPAQRSFAVIQPGSGSVRKNWPIERFIRLASRIRQELNCETVFLFGEAEEGLKERVEGAAPFAIGLSDLDLLTVSGLLKQSRFYIGNDSGITHLAAVLGIPTWALFGPTDPAHWAPRGQQVHIVRRPEPGVYPIVDLSEEMVWSALQGA